MQDLHQADYGQIELYYNSFMRPAYRSALATLALPPHTKGLDVGCGPGGLLPVLDEAVDEATALVGIDISQPHLIQAQRLIEQYHLQERVCLQAVDLRGPLPFEENTFDWAWCADVLWPLFFAQPVDVIKEIRRVVKPGGVIAIFFANIARTLLLPGYDDLELYLRLATRLKTSAAVSESVHAEHAHRWLLTAGLTDVRLSAHIASHQSPLNVDVLGYLEGFALPELVSITQEELAHVGMSPSSYATWRSISDPQSPHYVLRQQQYYCALFATLAVGHVPYQ